MSHLGHKVKIKFVFVCKKILKHLKTFKRQVQRQKNDTTLFTIMNLCAFKEKQVNDSKDHKYTDSAQMWNPFRQHQT